jgi:alpha-1,6-mannosyltransferase
MLKALKSCFFQEAYPQKSLLLIGFLSAILYYCGWALLGGHAHDAHERVWRQFFRWVLSLSSVFLYWRGYLLVSQLSSFARVKSIAVIGIVLAMIALFVPPFHSTDAYVYLNVGWLQLHYGLNPYVHVLNDISNWRQDPMFTHICQDIPCIYGFLFAHFTKIFAYLGQGRQWQAFLFLKCFNLLIYMATGWLVYDGAKKLSLKRPDLALYLYLWNPLILLHDLSNAHNDILMAFFTLLACYFVIIDAWLWVIPALCLAISVKYATAVILPLAMIFVAKQKGAKMLFCSLLAAIFMTALASYPYALDWSHFQWQRIFADTTGSSNSLHSALYYLYTYKTLLITPYHYNQTDIPANAFLKKALWIPFLTFYGWQLIQAVKGAIQEKQDFLFKAVLFQFVLVCLVSAKFYPWYVGMFFPLSLFLSEECWLRRLILLVSCTQIFAFTSLGQARVLNFFLMMGLPIFWIWRQEKQGRIKVSRPAVVGGSGFDQSDGYG